ncbi:hypothetical protein [Microbacterium sp. PMB16]|uniref:hypothetical protein n=1 Tax=Microbacterium sp. PMB16 TaxID=3120157 RepID=UPI003F4BF417
MARTRGTIAKTDEGAVAPRGPASAWLAGVIVGVVVVGGSVWVPLSIWVDGEDPDAWFRRVLEQVALNFAVDGWPMIAVSMGALALVVTIVAFVGTATWTVMSETKRKTLADTAWSLTLLATGIATFVTTAILLTLVPLVAVIESAPFIDSDEDALDRVLTGLRTQARLLLLGMVGLGVLVSCKYADGALAAWIRLDRDDAVKELQSLERRLQRVLLALAVPAWVMVRHRGPHSWDAVAARIAIAELTAGIAADRQRVANLTYSG